MEVFNNLRAILTRHKENMPVVVVAEMLAEIDGAEAECCEWKLEDAEANLYVTSCEQRQLIFEDTPNENGYRFCPYCGRKISEVE